MTCNLQDIKKNLPDKYNHVINGTQERLFLIAKRITKIVFLRFSMVNIEAYSATNAISLKKYTYLELLLIHHLLITKCEFYLVYPF